jgi:hypothetical protein
MTAMLRETRTMVDRVRAEETRRRQWQKESRLVIA